MAPASVLPDFGCVRGLRRDSPGAGAFPIGNLPKQPHKPCHSASPLSGARFAKRLTISSTKFPPSCFKSCELSQGCCSRRLATTCVGRGSYRPDDNVYLLMPHLHPDVIASTAHDMREKQIHASLRLQWFFSITSFYF